MPSVTGDRFGGQVVVVTGGSSGIGEAIARLFIAEGARAVVPDLTLPNSPIEGARYLSCDVSDRASVEAAFASLEQVEGRVDVLVNNAGIQRAALTDEFDPATWAQVLGVSLSGTFHCSALALRMMKRQRSGSIISVASVAGMIALPGRGPYSAAKAGIMSLTRVMAVEVAELGIRVNAVAPGSTRTPLVEQGLRNGSFTLEGMHREIPMRRLAAPDEIAKVVAFLASDDAGYITGQTIVVDGGWSILGIHERPDWLTAKAD